MYKTVVIGTQTWMAENLNYEVPNGGSWCYDNLESHCTVSGRIYDWATAMRFESSCNDYGCGAQIQTKHRGVCPEGWHVPRSSEWTTLVNFAGGHKAAQEKLRAIPPRGYGTDVYGFSALDGGERTKDGIFRAGGFQWWTSTIETVGGGYAYMRAIVNGKVDEYQVSKYNAFSVRCIQD